MDIRKADNPFCFVSCTELRQIMGVRAYDEQRLLEVIEEAPLDAIYYHTHSYFLRHEFFQGLYPNDFATWAAVYVQDAVLGERLGVIDPFGFDDLESLRSEITSIIADHLSRLKSIPRIVIDEPFEFIRSHIIETDLETEARTLQEFRDCMRKVEAGAIYNHVCEARMRKGRLFGDFAMWIGADDGLRLPQLGAQVATVGRRGLSLEGYRAEIIRLCEEALRHEPKNGGEEDGRPS